jgi:endonuclease/exonuclease/phosphatase family metal-dependent hydrolase
LNLLPDSELLEPLYARLKSVAKELGNDEYTFASFEPQAQIDHIFVPKSAKIKEYTVYKHQVSDHRPISAEIEI